MALPLVIAITGASGVIYGVNLLKALKDNQQDVELVMSDAAIRSLHLETDLSLDDVKGLARHVYNNKDIGAAIASGSYRTRGMIIAPCTIKTLSAVAHSYSDNLISRAADVMLKEKRRLILMVRETPLHKGHLDLMSRCSDLGATIMPPMPAFYHGPQTVQDIIDHSIGRVLDQFDIEHDLYKRWNGQRPASITP